LTRQSGDHNYLASKPRTLQLVLVIPRLILQLVLAIPRTLEPKAGKLVVISGMNKTINKITRYTLTDFKTINIIKRSKLTEFKELKHLLLIAMSSFFL